MSAFAQEKIRFSGPHGIERREAWTYRGVGFFREGFVLNPVWKIIHLNSGHQIAELRGARMLEAQIKDMVAEIADAGDWSFDGLTGFKNQFPDAAERVQEIVMKHLPGAVRRETNTIPDPVAAHAIALLREDPDAPIPPRSEDVEQ